MSDTSAPETQTAIDPLILLSEAGAAYEAVKAGRKAAAKTARANRYKYREIAEALNVSVNRAWTLVNEDAEDAA